MSETKRCPRCKQVRSLGDFPQRKRKGLPPKRIPRCADCEALRLRHIHHRRRGIAITAEEFDALNAAQGGLCAICGRAQPDRQPDGTRQLLCVDHDHGTGRVRALLCIYCNGGLGSFRDDPTLLEATAAYLRRHGK